MPGVLHANVPIPLIRSFLPAPAPVGMGLAAFQRDPVSFVAVREEVIKEMRARTRMLRAPRCWHQTRVFTLRIYFFRDVAFHEQQRKRTTRNRLWQSLNES